MESSDLMDKNQKNDSTVYVSRVIKPEEMEASIKSINDIMQKADVEFRWKQGISMEAASKVHLI